MAIGDTQEVAFAVVGGTGTTNLASVKVMKYNDRVAQVAYNNAFKLAKGPSSPKVKVFALDGQILLDWGLDSASVAQTEIPVLFGNYSFEGYNVYQVPDGATDLKNAKRLATFDLINGVRTISQEEFDAEAGEVYLRPVQHGTDNGIVRSLRISNGLPPPVGTVIKFIKFHEIRQGDVKEIKPLAPTLNDIKQARADITAINVFPNPYYGEALAPTGVVRHRVLFTHLPAKANVRIFSLAGYLVKTLVKDDGASGSQFLEWNLQNEFGLPVGSGIYIAHIEMPDLNATKTLKLERMC